LSILIVFQKNQNLNRTLLLLVFSGQSEFNYNTFRKNRNVLSVYIRFPEKHGILLQIFSGETINLNIIRKNQNMKKTMFYRNVFSGKIKIK